MTTKLCYECGAEKDEVLYKKCARSDGHVRCCIECEAELYEPDPVSARHKSNNVTHIEAFSNMRNLPSKTGYVYFVKEVDRDQVLVGHTSDLNAELKMIRKCFYEDMVCLLALPGTPQHVESIKSVFAEYHQHDTWFSYGHELSNWIIQAKFKKQPSMDFALGLAREVVAK